MLGKLSLFPRRLAHGLSRFWITCMILRAGGMQTAVGITPLKKHRKQSRTARAIIRDRGVSGTKHLAGPDRSAWASRAISKALQPPPVPIPPRRFRILPQHPKPDFWALCKLPPSPKPGPRGGSAASLPSTVWLVSSFWGALGLFRCGFGVFFFESLSQQKNSVKNITVANF